MWEGLELAGEATSLGRRSILSKGVQATERLSKQGRQNPEDVARTGISMTLILSMNWNYFKAFLLDIHSLKVFLLLFFFFGY